MKQHTIALGILALSSLVAVAQDPAPMGYADRIKSVENLKQHIAQREARYETVKQDLKSLDARVEKQVNDIVKTLAGLKDSNDSKTVVANIKEDVIKGLERTIWVYRQKRMDVFERMRKNSNVPKEELDKTMKVFDDRIGKRLAQIMELAKSFPGHEDVKKYESLGSTYYNGWYEENSRISDEWRQNRRASTSGRTVRRDVLKEIDSALDRNQARRASISDALANRKLSDKARALQSEELGRVDAVIDDLKAKRRQLVLPGTGNERSIGDGEAHDAGKMLDDARRDLSRDFGDIMSKYSQLDAERTRIFDLKANLAAREAWLKKNPPPAK